MKHKEAMLADGKGHAIPLEQVARFLKETPLLCEVPERQLYELAKKARLVHVPKGGAIFHIGENPHWMYILCKGYITECVTHGSSMNIIVKTRKKHDYIGEMGILSGQPYPNSAIAMEDVLLFAFSKETFESMLQMHFSVSRYIILQLIDRLTNSAIKMINTMYLDAPARLAFTIVSLSGDMEGHHHAISVTQSELAAASGTARQTVAKILGEWRREAYIKTERGKLTILNMDALMEIITLCESNL